MRCSAAICRFLRSSSAKLQARRCRSKRRSRPSGGSLIRCLDCRVRRLDPPTDRPLAHLPRSIEFFVHREWRVSLLANGFWPRPRSFCEMDDRQRLQGALKVEQRVQEKSERQRTATPAHPAKEKADDENLQHTRPIVLDVKHCPQNRERDDRAQPRNRNPRNMASSPAGAIRMAAASIGRSHPAAAAVV